MEFFLKLLRDQRNPCEMTSNVFKYLVTSMDSCWIPVGWRQIIFWNSCEMTPNIFTTLRKLSQHFHNTCYTDLSHPTRRHHGCSAIPKHYFVQCWSNQRGQFAAAEQQQHVARGIQFAGTAKSTPAEPILSKHHKKNSHGICVLPQRIREYWKKNV